MRENQLLDGYEVNNMSMFNAPRQCGKSLYLIKRAIQLYEGFLKGENSEPVIVVHNNQNVNYKKQMLYKYYGDRYTIKVMDIFQFMRLQSAPHNYEVLIDEVQYCIDALVVSKGCKLSDGTLTVLNIENPCRQLLKEI